MKGGHTRTGFPIARPGMAVGLLGGSFDPPHGGHVHITREALKRFGLDRVWWLVTPGNPLKSHGPAPLERRIAAAHQVMDHPAVKITGIEAALGTRYTAQTLDRLFQIYPGVRFIWLMGADNFAQLHRWDRWEWIMQNVAIGVLARPGQRISARMSVAASRFGQVQLRGREAARLVLADPPTWCFVNMPMDATSSTAIRAKGGWTR